MELAILAGGHIFGDYLLQGDWLALNKHKNVDALLKHCIIYTLFASASLHMLGAANVWTITIVFISHVVIDHRKWSVPWSSYPPLPLIIDQSAHAAVLVGCVVWVVGM